MGEAIILAGGKGTRLSSIVSNVPKPMAPVGGRPFLEYIFDRLIKFEFSHVILSVGYKADIIVKYFGEKYQNLKITYEVEKEPLGTGGAIKKSLLHIKSESAIVINGDTYAELDYSRMLALNAEYNSVVIGCVQVADTHRYGSLKILDGKVTEFIEKGGAGAGIVNAGCYAISKNEMHREINKTSFSFEEEYLKKKLISSQIMATISTGKFIDIGIPADYHFAHKYLKNL